MHRHVVVQDFTQLMERGRVIIREMLRLNILTIWPQEMLSGPPLLCYRAGLAPDDVPPAGWPTYTATYRFQTRTALGSETFELAARTTVAIGNFGTCPEETSD